MTSVHELLEQGAASPSRPFDVDVTMHVVGRRRRNRHGIFAALAVVVACVVVFAVVEVDQDASRSVVVPPAAPTLEPFHVPDGWTPVSDAEGGIALAIPPGWRVLPKEAATGDPNEPSNLIVAGSAPGARADGLIAACAPLDAIPAAPGTWVSIHEYTGDDRGELPTKDEPGPYAVIGGRLIDGFAIPETSSFAERPDSFLDVPVDVGLRCGHGGGDTNLEPVENAADFVFFRDGGRLLLARIVTVGDPARAGLIVGREVLDTLRVEPASEPVPAPDDAELRREPYRLYTHCGIEWAQIDGLWWQADTPLSDGSGNPPCGWGNPFQDGELVFRDESTAEFQSSAGRVRFQRTERTDPPFLCS